MNLDEETFLTAYVDGALTPEQRLRVEAALESDPGLADHLRGLTAVRDLVAGLSRPGPSPDVSEAVLAQIARRPAWLPLSFPLPLPVPTARAWRWAAAAAAVAVVSASLAIAVSGGRRHGAPVEQRVQADPSIPTPAPPPAPVTVARHVDAPPQPQTPVDERATSAVEEILAERGPDREERQQDFESQQFRRVFDNTRKVFLVTDDGRGRAAEAVGDLIAKTPRKVSSYFCMTVPPGVDVDPGPETPGVDRVFAVVLTDVELDQFPKLLKERLPDSVRVTESDPKPESVTQLAALVEPIQVFQGTRVAGVIVPEEAIIGHRDTPRPPGIVVRPYRGFEFFAPGASEFGPTGASPRPDPGRTSAAVSSQDKRPDTPETPGADAGQAPTGAGPPARDRRLSVVLVMVTRPPREGPGMP
jgi:hypothetical protein